MKNASKLILFDLILSLSTGRWGSWFGIPEKGIFLIDIILLFAVLVAIYEGELSIPSLGFAIVFAYVIWQFARNPSAPVILRVRDLLPFLYLIVFWMLRNSIKRIPKDSLMKGLRFASAFSLAWNIPVSLDVIKPFMLNPFSGIEVFSQRPDHAGVVAGIGCLVWGSSWAYPKGNNRQLLQTSFPYLFVIQTLLTSGRAGLIAVSLCFIYSIFLDNISEKVRRKKIQFFAIGVFFLLVGPTVLKLLPENSSFARLGLVSTNELAAQAGQGTASARKIAADIVIKWTKDNKRMLIGAGPGYEILSESGAVKWLSGALDVRYPHNWWLSLYSRYGIFGLILWNYYLFKFWAIPSNLRHYKTPIIISLLLVATLGVIVESPFGLWPLFFFLFR